MQYFKIGTAVFLLFSFTFSFSQMGSLGSLTDLQTLNVLNNTTGKETIDLKNVSGSPYLEEVFSKGILVSRTDDNRIEVYIRYNVFSDNFEAKYTIEDSQISILDRTNQFKIEFGDKKYTFVQSNYVFEKTGTGYLAILSEPDAKYVFYKKYYSQYTPEKNGATSYDSAKPARVETKYNYYLKNNDTGEFIEIEDHRNKIIKTLPTQYQSNVKSFIKNNDLKMKGSQLKVEVEIRKVVDYINTL